MCECFLGIIALGLIWAAFDKAFAILPFLFDSGKFWLDEDFINLSMGLGVILVIIAVFFGGMKILLKE
jgi:hypothetical protein